MSAPDSASTPRRRLFNVSRLEWLVLLAIIAALVALLFPLQQWASSGEIEYPVRVLVFDATTGKPIVGCRVAVIRHKALSGDDPLKDYGDPFPQQNVFENIPAEDQGVTDATGSLTVTRKFSTGASSHHPHTRARLTNVWVVAQAKAYGGVAIPVGYASMPLKELRASPHLLVPIGLVPLGQQ